MNASPAVGFRGMTQGDVDAGLRLCRLSHWNQVARDWEQFLRLSPGGATVAVDDDGVVIGSVATMRFAAEGSAGLSQPGVPEPSGGERLPPQKGSMAWIAMVLVDPARRGSGIGTALLQRGLEQVADVTTVGLDATPLGRPLYETLGFRADSTLTRMRREPAPLGAPATGHDQRSHVRNATPADHDAIAVLDAQVSGLDRQPMLGWLQGGAPELAWVFDGDRGIEGSVLGRPGYAAIHLGPVIAPSTDVAAQLVRAVLSAQSEHAVLIDVADDRPGWRHAVEALGFQAQRPFTRMYRGEWRPPADPARLYAIIGPEFG